MAIETLEKVEKVKKKLIRYNTGPNKGIVQTAKRYLYYLRLLLLVT